MSKRKPRIVEVRQADENHAVVSVAVPAADFRYCTSPCPECPWRRENAGSFPAEAFRLSAHTAYDTSDRTFACHMAGTEKSTVCAGFLLRGAVHNLTVRFRIMTGHLDPNKVSDGGADLFDNYREMAEANGVPADDPALKNCRDD